MKKIVVLGGGISGLASAYLIQQQAKEANIPVDITIIEATERLGGKIWSRTENGYLCESGPNGFLTNRQATLDLCASLGISSQLVVANANARARFVYADGRLHKLPHNLREFLGCSLLSLRGKLRLMAEFILPKRQLAEDESLAQFAKRRLGQEALTKLIAPMANGIFAGNPDTMSLAACFPKIYQLEQTYGGLIKGMLQLRKQRAHQANPQSSATPAGPGGVLTSFAQGMETLIQELARQLADSVNIIYNASEYTLGYQPAASTPWQLKLADQEIIADELVVALPAYQAATLFATLDPQLAAILKQIQYSPLVVVACGFNAAEIPHDLAGFGYLLAPGSPGTVLGNLWDSSIFINRAPNGRVLLRTMLGGAKHPNIIERSDAEIKAEVLHSLNQILHIQAKPELLNIYRHPQAIPAYNLGHLTRVTEIQALAGHYQGLTLTGNAYHGVGINDCVAAAYQTADAVLMRLNGA